MEKKTPKRPPPGRGSGARGAWRAASLVALVAAAVYANSALNEFVFDDRLVIERNPAVRGEGGLGELLLAPYHWGLGEADTGLYRPLTLVSFRIDFEAGGMRPTGYHVVNIVLHALASVLVLRTGLRIGLAGPAALGGALLFAVHPVHTEAVANLAGRAELLSAVFFLAALITYSSAVDREGPAHVRRLALACSVGFLALLSKENAVTLVGVATAWDLLLVRDVREDRAGRARMILRWAALAGTLAIYMLLRRAALGSFGGPETISSIDNPLVGSGWLERWATAAVVSVRYIGLLVFPLKLSADYSWPQIPPVSPWSPEAAGAALLVAVLIVALVRAVRRAPRAAFLGVFTLVTFSVVSNAFVLIGTIMAERLLYLPSVGFCLLAGVLLVAATRRLGARAAWALALVILSLASWRTVDRSRDWRNALTLFSTAAQTSPRSVKVKSNLGAELLRRGRVGEALEVLAEALAIEPDYTPARVNLAQARLRAGDLEGAERELHRALREKPEDRLALIELSEVLARRGRTGEAEAVLGRVLEREPFLAPARAKLGAIHLARGEFEAAEAQLSEAVRLAPDLVTARNDLALLYERTGRIESAVTELREAVRRAPDTVPLLNNLGNALRQAGRLEESLREFERAIELQPDFGPTHYNAGLVLERLGRLHEARERYARAVELRPDDASSWRGLGRIALEASDPATALDHLERSLGLDDTEVETHALRARALMALAQHPEAERAYRRVLELDPRSVEARNSLGILAAMRGDRKAARRHWEETARGLF